jgi:uncharacterized protein
MLHITGLFVYPVKSCRGIALQEAQLDRRGIVHDREFLVVDEENVFLTQRTVPQLATIETELHQQHLVLRAAAAGQVEVPLAIDGSAPPVQREVQIFKDRVVADDCGDEAAEWFSSALGRKCRLVRLGSAFVRQVAPAGIAAADIPFTDEFPLHLTAEESLADLNRRLDEPLPMSRFRPSIVVRGAEPYAENTWRSLRDQQVQFRFATPCYRCSVTMTDQQTGTRGSEPLRTLATYRRGEAGGVMFGQYLIHSGPGTLRVGETLVAEQNQ